MNKLVRNNMNKLVRNLATMIMVMAMTLGMTTPVCAASTEQDQVLALVSEINAVRTANGLDPVQLDDTLTSAADVRVHELETSFSHTRPNGRAWYTVDQHVAGENLSRGTLANSTPYKIVLAWTLSPSHKTVLTHSTFTRVGVSFHIGADGRKYCAAEFG